MKKIFLLFVVASLIAGCKSSTKMMQNGWYDQAIEKSIKKIKRKASNDKEKLVLEQSFNKANERDKERIEFLKKEGTPENWDNIFELYSTLNSRQQRVKPLLPLRINNPNRNANIQLINYDNEIIQAKQKAAEYFYAHAMLLLQKGHKEDARSAYGELLRVKSYYNNFKDVDSQINRAKTMGLSYVLFKMKNATGVPLPPNFESELTKISLSELDREWLRYHTQESSGVVYDYTILVNMKNIDVSPESVKEIQYTETKQIPDGYQYALDEKGNVKKDAGGNDIKTPKTKIISCNVIETYQNKKAIIAGTLDYINNYNKQLIKTDPIAAEHFFEYRSATAIGEISALKPETKAKIGLRPLPFPSGFDMLLNAGQTLKGMVKNIIWANKGVIN